MPPNYTAYTRRQPLKDLASDFRAAAVRSFKLWRLAATTMRFLADCWPAAVEALRYLKHFDATTTAFPTTRRRTQPSTLATAGGELPTRRPLDRALRGALAMAQTAQLEAGASTPGALANGFRPGWLEQSRANFDALLWNGEYLPGSMPRSGRSGGRWRRPVLCGGFFLRARPVWGPAPGWWPRRALRSSQLAVPPIRRKACFERFEGGRWGFGQAIRPCAANRHSPSAGTPAAPIHLKGHGINLPANAAY